MAPRTRDYVPLVEDYLANGGRILRVPFGIGGLHWTFYDTAAQHARGGWLARYGLRCVPDEARSFVMQGALSLRAARAPIVWSAIAQIGEPDRPTLVRSLRLSSSVLSGPLELLFQNGHVARRLCEHKVRYRATGAAPDWRDFLDLRKVA